MVGPCLEGAGGRVQTRQRRYEKGRTHSWCLNLRHNTATNLPTLPWDQWVQRRGSRSAAMDRQRPYTWYQDKEDKKAEDQEWGLCMRHNSTYSIADVPRAVPVLFGNSLASNIWPCLGGSIVEDTAGAGPGVRFCPGLHAIWESGLGTDIGMGIGA